LEWSRNYSVSNAIDVVGASDGGYAILGSGQGGATLIKTDSAGRVQWNQTYNSTATGDEAFGIDPKSLVYTSDRGYAIAGITYPPGSEDANVMLMKIDATGIILWRKTYGGPGDDTAHSVIQTSDGGYAMLGYAGLGGLKGSHWMAKTDSKGNAQWSRVYGFVGFQSIDGMTPTKQ
jgi:hypothetical protein